MKQKIEHDDMLELRRKFTPTKHNLKTKAKLSNLLKM